MANNKKNNIPHYELLYIIPNKYTEDDAREINEKIKKLIEHRSGKVTHEEFWGKKKFCYPIKHELHGYYSLLEFDVEADKINQINTDLRMASDILRHMIVNRPPKTEEQLANEKRMQEKRLEKIAAKKEDFKKEEKKIEKKSVSNEKVDSKELDEKLNKILETDDLL